LTAAERTICRGIPTTTVERTIIDLAGRLSDEKLGKCVDDAIRRGLMSLERLRALATTATPSRGRLLKPVHKILADRMAGYRPDESDFETDMNLWWERRALPAAVRQHEVVIEGRRYRLDRAIVAYKIGIEWDSYRFHNLESDRDRDSTRRARLAGDGWFIIPVTANADPEAVARAVWRVYHDRGGPAQ
jgi:very-short-patch-repair endonuclease